MNSDKIKMEVNIAGERIALTVPFSRQEAVRHTESEISALLKSWKLKFPDKSPKELIAMTAYQYASRYYDLLETMHTSAQDAEDLLEEVTKLCDRTDDSTVS